ncbi:MAG TPA: glycoside hydrolase family 31 protein [Ktedonobacterales bacterium]
MPYTWLGDVTAVERVARGVALASGPARVAITALAPGIVRVRLAPDGTPLPRRPWAVDRPAAAWPDLPLTLREDEDAVELDTGTLRVRVTRRPLRVSFVAATGAVFAADDPARGCGWRADGAPPPAAAGDAPALVCQKLLPPGEHCYGLGERTGMLDKRGSRYTNWTTDTWNHGPATDMMYHAIPWLLALRPATGLCYGLYLNNTFRTVFDLGHTDADRYRLEAAGGEMDYFLIHGATPAEVVRGFTELTGRMPLPPRWALGYQQSRWSYATEAEVRAVAAGFRAHDLPGEVIYLDIDYMDGFRDFTWNRASFPQPARLISDLRAQGFRVVPIIDPGIKDEPDNPVYDSGVAGGHFLRDAQGALAHGHVWPGECVFPDFARAATRVWWAEWHRALIANGVSGIWNDMNEPSTGGGELPLDAPAGDDTRPATFAEVHNVYAHLEAQATRAALLASRPDERPFVLTRAGFAGTPRYSAMWTGDNVSSWEHLEMSLPQLSNLGLSGVALCGADIGGFIGNATPELFARWIELGALYPFARGHTVRGSAPHEPWVFGDEVTAIARRYLELRYRLLPYLYTLIERAAATGEPLWRPLVYAYPTDPAVTALHDQVLIGPDLLVAPIWRPGAHSREVYLPAGTWHDYWTGAQHSGPRDILAPAPLGTLPLYARARAIIPSGPALPYSDERPLDDLTLDVYLGGDASEAVGELYEDDGHTFAYQQGAFRRTRYHCQRTAAGATITATVEGAYHPAPRALTLRIHGAAVGSAVLGGQTLPVAPSAPGEPPHSRVSVPADPGAWTIHLMHA